MLPILDGALGALDLLVHVGLEVITKRPATPEAPNAYPEPWADPKSRSALGFGYTIGIRYYSYVRNMGPQYWELLRPVQ